MRKHIQSGSFLRNKWAFAVVSLGAVMASSSLGFALMSGGAGVKWG